MSRFSPSCVRSPLSRHAARRCVSGRASSAGLLLAFLAISGGCSSDDDGPAEPTGAASTADAPDASVRELRGDGLEPTPDFDIEERQRDPIGPERRNEEIERLLNGAAGDNSGPDASAPNDEADAGAVNGTN